MRHMELCNPRAVRRSSFGQRILWALCSLATLGYSQNTLAETPQTSVLIVTSGNTSYYQEVAEATTSRIAAQCPEPCARPVSVTSLPVGRLDDRQILQHDILIALGSQASLQVAQRHPAQPTVYSLIPHSTWQEIQRCCASPPGLATAIFRDQPLSRQFELLTLAFPEKRRIGVLLGPASKRLFEPLRATAKQREYELVIETMADDAALGATLRTVLVTAEVLLALPDPTIYNRRTIFPIIMSTYNARVPIFGYSRAMVDAGAVIGLFSTPADMGRQVSEIVLTVQRSRALPKPAFPKYFQVTLNAQVARSLGITLGDPADLARALRGNSE